MHLERDQKITAFVLAGLLLAFVLGVYLPNQSVWSDLDDRADRARQEVRATREQNIGLASVAERVSQLRQTVGASRKTVPASIELASLLRSLGDQLSSQQVTDTQLVTEAVEQGIDFNVVPLSLSFKGGFADVFNFLRQTESLERLVSVTRINIVGDDQAGGGPLEVRVELCSFFADGRSTTSADAAKGAGK